MNTDFCSQVPFVSLVQFALFTPDLLPASVFAHRTIALQIWTINGFQPRIWEESECWERWVVAYHMFILISGLDSSLHSVDNQEILFALLSLQTCLLLVAVQKIGFPFRRKPLCPLFEPYRISLL